MARLVRIVRKPFVALALRLPGLWSATRSAMTCFSRPAPIAPSVRPECLLPRPMAHWTHFPHRQVPGEFADFIADAAVWRLVGGARAA
jgi:hypothetical protein